MNQYLQSMKIGGGLIAAVATVCNGAVMNPLNVGVVLVAACWRGTRNLERCLHTMVAR